MKAVRRRIIGLFLLAALLAAGGCGGDGPALTAETDEPLYREGQQMEKQGRTQEALNDYLKLIAKRGEQAPESELDVGLIYLSHIKEPIEAIHYFDMYLVAEPNSHQAPYVKGLIEAAERDFASTLPAQPLENQAPRLELADEVDRLQRENAELKAELALRSDAAVLPPMTHVAASGLDPAAAQPTYSSSPPAPADEAPSPLTPAPLPPNRVERVVPNALNAAASQSSVPARKASALGTTRSTSNRQAAGPAGRVHTVAHGDTLVSLARHYYGNPSSWHQILAANRDQLPDDKTPLRLGMVLKIP